MTCYILTMSKNRQTTTTIENRANRKIDTPL